MSLRTIATLAIAIVLGLVAVVILNGYLGSQKKAAPQQQVASGAGAPVVVAAAPIKRGVVLQPSLLKVVNYPAGSVPAGAFSTVAQLTGAKDVQRLALRDLAPDEPVLAVRVTAPGGKLNLAGLLDPGMQAVTLHSTDIQEVSGFVLPGDHVDLLLTRTIGGGGNSQQSNSVTQILAENMKVLAIDQSDDDEADKPVVAHAITIEVTPEQAQLITLGQSVGAVTLSLRHVDDTAPLAKKATVLAQLGFTAPAPLPAGVAGGHPARPAGPEVRVTRMTDTTVYQLSGH